MSQHTKEPWFVETESSYWDIRHKREDGRIELIGDTFASKFIREGDVGKDNADRIVACVNACEGINPAAVPMIMAALVKLKECEILCKVDIVLWAEVVEAVRVAKDGVE